MKPPADLKLDFYGAGTDVPVEIHPRRGLNGPLVFLIASLLGLGSTTLAWHFTNALSPYEADWRTLLMLNCSYWYLWAAVTPAIVWLSQRFRFERQGLIRALIVHLPAVAIFSLGHIAAMGGVQWWLAMTEERTFFWWEEVRRTTLQYFDWEMMTYWTIVGLSHAVLYYRESHERAVRASRLETRLVEAQLKSLQQQLHPHFLFNTLHAISALMHKDVEAADRTLMRLSDLLRMSLETIGQQEVTLHAELDFVGKYVQIEQTRFADRLVVRYDVQPDTLDGLVPNFILQPLVENAIKHGVARKAGCGHIDISARRDGGKLLLEVRDDGVGLSEDALTALQKGIGVSTTRARLQHLFGADYRFEFHRQQQGLAVLIGIPWHTGNGDSIDEDAEQQAQANPPAARLRLRHGTAEAR